jgi:hypothetical protein
MNPSVLTVYKCPFPNIFECTYLNKKYFEAKTELNTEKIPTSIDKRNLEHLDDIYIDYPSFVN